MFRTKEGDSKQRMWFVFDNALILPEYLVEFEYLSNNPERRDFYSVPGDDTPHSTESATTSTSRKQNAVGSNEQRFQAVVEECNRLFAATNEAQKILNNTYIHSGSERHNKNNSFHLSSNDLERSDMGCIKTLLSSFLRSCHVKELQ